ncbi:sugar transferase [Pseudoalteromonas apostichopi]|uniref:sugar transferase n=1 Tax=Pseudoalteromonas apostichopi TaxID=3035452 RepID=UPI002572BB51|nr:sugar transferase [Pseudoalteromonas sp. FE4]
MLKRLFDILFSVLGIFVLLPVYLLIAILIKMDSSGSIIFKQKRVGKNERQFHVYKFRTMVVDAEKMGMKITVGRDPRITKFGHFLRKYKLDELPQIFNVLFGSMSFVGPRPEVQEYIDEYPKAVKKEVLSVKPGITDNASIEFRNESEMLFQSLDPRKTYIDEILPIKQKLYLDYVRNKTFIGDIKIIIKTIVKILR